MLKFDFEMNRGTQDDEHHSEPESKAAAKPMPHLHPSPAPTAPAPGSRLPAPVPVPGSGSGSGSGSRLRFRLRFRLPFRFPAPVPAPAQEWALPSAFISNSELHTCKATLSVRACLFSRSRSAAQPFRALSFALRWASRFSIQGFRSK